RSVRQQPDHRALELADVALDVVGDELHHLVRQLDAVVFGLAPHDGDAGFQFRRFQIRREAPLEAREQPLLDALDLARRAVSRKHDLLARLVQRVEDVEEFLLRLLLAAEELYVVDDEQVNLAVEQRELADAVVLDGLDELGGEALAGDVEHRLGAVRLDVVADGLNQVRLAEADAAVDHERVEARLPRLLRDGKRGAPGQAVAVALDEASERVALVELAVDLRPLDARNHKRIRDGHRRLVRKRFRGRAVTRGRSHRCRWRSLGLRAGRRWRCLYRGRRDGRRVVGRTPRRKVHRRTFV